MPTYLAGKGKWTKLCESCGKPFVKTARVQKRCEKCKLKRGPRLYGEISITQKNTNVCRVLNQKT